MHASDPSLLKNGQTALHGRAMTSSTEKIGVLQKDMENCISILDSRRIRYPVYQLSTIS